MGNQGGSLYITGYSTIFIQNITSINSSASQNGGFLYALDSTNSYTSLMNITNYNIILL